MATRKGYSLPVFSQQGFATLTVALTISFLATFMTLYVANVEVVAQRVAANEVRAGRAFAAAEAGIAKGIAYLRSYTEQQVNAWTWTACGSEITPPCGNGTKNVYDSHWKYYSNGNTTQLTSGSYRFYFLRPAVSTDLLTLWVVATGQSTDGSGQAFVRQGVYLYPLEGGFPEAPVVSKYALSISSNNVIDDNNQAPLAILSGEGITLNSNVHTQGPVQAVGGITLSSNAHITGSAWAGGDIALDSNAYITGKAWAVGGDIALGSTSRITGPVYPQGGVTLEGNAYISDTSGANPRPAPGFPSDLFEYVFGVPKAQWRSIRDNKATALSDCYGLNTSSSGLYWISGNCTISSNIDVGSAASPVLLVVDGYLEITSNQMVYGLVFYFPVTYDPSNSGPGATFSSNASVQGAVIAEGRIKEIASNFNVQFDKTILTALYEQFHSAGGMGVTPIPGSWADF